MEGSGLSKASGGVPWPDTPAVRRVLAALWVLAVAWAIAWHVRVPVLPYDDAYITFRHADHLAGGLGPVYNPGERVFGSSTPLYTAWLALGRVLFPMVPTPDLAVRGNAVFFVIAAIAGGSLVQIVAGNLALALFASLLMLLDPLALAVSVGGMETMGFLSLALLSLGQALRGRGIVAGILAGLALLTRPEGAVILPILGGVLWPRGRGALLGAALAWAAVVALWVVPATIELGTPVPHSILAKARPLYPLPPLGSVSLLSWWAGRWAFGGFGESLGHWRTLPLLVLALGASLPLVAHRPLRHRGTWVLPGAFFGIVAFYAWTNPLPFEWYWPCLWAFLLLLLVVGLATVWLSSGPLARLVAPGTALVTAWLLFASVTPWGRSCDGSAPDQDLPPVTQVACDPTRLRVLAYQETARRIAEEARPGETLAGPEIGALGYYYPGRMLDACGLVTPEALPFLPVPPDQRASPIDGAISTDFVRAMRPDWVAFIPFFARASLLRSPWFRQEYRPVFSVPLLRPCWGSRTVEVYRRRSSDGDLAAPGT